MQTFIEQGMIQEERESEYNEMGCCCFDEKKTAASLVERKIT